MQDKKWIKGPRGASYYINEQGDKVYRRYQEKKYPRGYKPKQGAFYRHLQNQRGKNGDNLNLC